MGEEKSKIELKGNVEYMELLKIVGELLGSVNQMDFHKCGKCGMTEEDCLSVNCNECITKKIYLAGANSMATNIMAIVVRETKPTMIKDENADADVDVFEAETVKKVPYQRKKKE